MVDDVMTSQTSDRDSAESALINKHLDDCPLAQVLGDSDEDKSLDAVVKLCMVAASLAGELDYAVYLLVRAGLAASTGVAQCTGGPNDQEFWAAVESVRQNIEERSFSEGVSAMRPKKQTPLQPPPAGLGVIHEHLRQRGHTIATDGSIDGERVPLSVVDGAITLGSLQRDGFWHRGRTWKRFTPSVLDEIEAWLAAALADREKKAREVGVKKQRDAMVRSLRSRGLTCSARDYGPPDKIELTIDVAQAHQLLQALGRKHIGSTPLPDDED